ncbi:NADH dehydrogenase FAD-containing subunit [Rhizobium sp. BK456]|nr:NADH dehydrogenase FAD-containing subunit [Rhizobium sp. BK456]
MRITVEEADSSSPAINRNALKATRRQKVVILGAGFGGLAAAMGLRHADVDVTVIDRRNYHLFQPLLYQVATAGLSPAQIAMPIRRILSRQANVTVLMERAEGIDKEARIVQTANRRIPYDYLIIATGARHAYFGNDE